MSDSRALAFVESFVSEFIAECRDTLDELSNSKIAAGDGTKAVASSKMSADAKKVLVRYVRFKLQIQNCSLYSAGWSNIWTIPIPLTQRSKSCVVIQV